MTDTGIQHALIVNTVYLSDKSYLKAKSPLRFDVYFIDRLDMYEATGPIDICVIAQTIAELKTELSDELASCWRMYVINPDLLSQFGIHMRGNLLDHFEEVQLA